MAQEPFSSLPVRRIEEHRRNPLPRGEWPATVPAVRQVLDEGLDLGPLTVLVGENGAGKSTLVEGIAEAYGLSVEGGTRDQVLHRTQATESGLHHHLQLVRGVGGARDGVFLRAETMHGTFAYLSEVNRPGGAYNFQSHGESFLEFLVTRSRTRGLWIFDEAESALSFTACMALVGQVRKLLAEGSQVVLSTHSPLLAALPEADLYELGEWGLRPCAYDDLDMVRNWRLFLDAPQRFLRHLDS
ncbi:ATPase AAA [Kocuria rhizophila]|nr:ATPase AAA [Kocuria rhizophila]